MPSVEKNISLNKKNILGDWSQAGNSDEGKEGCDLYSGLSHKLRTLQSLTTYDKINFARRDKTLGALQSKFEN